MSEFTDGDVPQLDRVAEFDHTKVADEVLWPYIEERYGLDWREHGALGSPLILPYRGTTSEQSTDVEIVATAERDDVWHDGLLVGIELTVSRQLTGEYRDMVLRAMLNWRDRQNKTKGKLPLDRYSDDTGLLKVSVTGGYSINSNDELEITRFQSVTNPYGADIWTSQELELEDIELDDELGTYLSRQIFYQPEGDTMLQGYDMDEIQAGLIIAQASPLVLDALRRIRGSPLSS